MESVVESVLASMVASLGIGVDDVECMCARSVCVTRVPTLMASCSDWRLYAPVLLFVVAVADVAEDDDDDWSRSPPSQS